MAVLDSEDALAMPAFLDCLPTFLPITVARCCYRLKFDGAKSLRETRILNQSKLPFERVDAARIAGEI